MDKLGLLKKSIAGLILGLALSANQSYAAKITMDFEGVGNVLVGNRLEQAFVTDFYNNGTDSLGKRGSNFGVSFSSDAFGIIDSDVNFDFFTGNFANEPSSGTALIFLIGGSATMNVPGGFNSAFSLFYSSSTPSVINIYDGLDGTGNKLASLALNTNHKLNCTGDRFGDWCHWDQVNVTFKGTAKSVVFDGPRETTFYDNITLGTDDKNDCKRRRFFKGKWNSENDNDNDDSNRCNPIPKECRYLRKNRYNHHIWYR